jgi:hypothetical protein
MCLGRLGSLNSLEQLRSQSSWLKENLRSVLPSTDTLGRVFSKIDTDTLRQVNHQFYDRLKRNKALELKSHGLIAVVVDGHESHATYLRCCDGCLERTINKGTDSERIQYYHRNVTAQLIFERIADFSLMPKRSCLVKMKWLVQLGCWTGLSSAIQGRLM